MSIELPPGTAAYSDRSEPPRKRQLLLLLFLIGLLIAGFFWLIGAAVEGLVMVIPPQVERQLGALIVPAYERIAKPSPAQDTLNQLLDRLENHLPAEQRQARDYRVLLIPETVVNAMAIPGDRVIIYQGLLDQVESENELMMVLGHELGHFTNRDHMRGLGRTLVIQTVLATFFGDIGTLQSIALSGVTALNNAQFSQQQEYKADEVGLKLLNAAYGHAGGATDFFERIGQNQMPDLRWLATHPSSPDRVRRLEDAIASQNLKVGEKTPLPAAL